MQLDGLCVNNQPVQITLLHTPPLTTRGTIPIPAWHPAVTHVLLLLAPCKMTSQQSYFAQAVPPKTNVYYSDYQTQNQTLNVKLS